MEAIMKFLRVERAKKNCTQAEAAESCGVHWRTWSQWESDGTAPTFVNMQAIAKWAGVSLDDLAEMVSGVSNGD